MENIFYYISAGVLGFIIGRSVRRENKFNSIIKTLNKMGDQLTAIKADLQAANLKADKIQADVTKLTNAIGNTGETPTPEEWAEVKLLSTDLNNKLQGIDDQTEDDAPPPPEG